MTPLPIEPVIPELGEALGRSGVAVLQAPPGAGKTTRVPLALLEQPWCTGGILLLEPRRLAARAAARRMAAMVGEAVGRRVGYRIRRDVVVGRETRIEVVTEGILTRMLQSDPGLPGYGLVIFDEFHERNLQGDLGLALALQSRALLRPDLRLLVMSATLEGEPVARLLGGAPIVTSEGRAYPVDTRYRPPRAASRVEAAAAAAVREALADTTGDVLVFLPGAGEIRRTGELLTDLGPSVAVVPLHGSLTGDTQDQAIAPDPGGRRKVVLATSIAETSLTIEGVRVVIDAGLARVPRFSPASGMSRLVTVRVSRSSADQRRGRAGRTGPGVCYRLWAAQEDHHLLPRPTPEILEADLAPLALELAVTGVSEPADLAWLDPPPSAAVAEGRALLRQLGALDERGRVTPHGRSMAELGTHPRLAHLLLAGKEAGAANVAAALTAILEERDFLRAENGPADPDLQLRLDLVRSRETPAMYHGHAVDRGTLHRVRQEAATWARLLRDAPRVPGADPPSPGLLLALAYPDRIARRREGQAGRFLLRNGQGAESGSPALALHEFLVAAQLDGDRRESRIWLGAPVEREELLDRFREQVEQEDAVTWTEGGIKAVRRERLGAIVLEERPLRDPDPALLSSVVLRHLREEGLGALTWSDAATELRQRLAFLRRLTDQGEADGAWPEVSDPALLAAAESWLGDRLGRVRRQADLAAMDLAGALLDLLTWEQRRALDLLAPTHFTVPSGSRIRLDYSDPAVPVLAVRLQEVFGLTETPRIGGGRVPVTIHLLSPAGRPVQVTRDLAGFWRSSYFEVRKEMKGRYPRHYWPDDPLVAEPTRRAKPRRPKE